MARELKEKPAELWMTKVTSRNLRNGFERVDFFGPFSRRGDAVGAGTRAKRVNRHRGLEQRTEYFSTDCEWKTRL